MEDINASELMKNKTANAISSLSGKIAGVNITYSPLAPQDPVLRSSFVVVLPVRKGKDNQPLFVVDGIIWRQLNEC